MHDHGNRPRILRGSFLAGALSSAAALALTMVSPAAFAVTARHLRFAGNQDEPSYCTSKFQNRDHEESLNQEPPLAVITPSLIPARVGISYSASLTAIGCPGPYDWQVAKPSIPAGIHLTSGGALTGVPQVAGTYHFTVSVADGESPPASVVDPLTLVVKPGITISTVALDRGEVGLPYAATLLVEGANAHATWSVTSGTLPPGLILLPTGLIEGVPLSAGNSQFSVTVTTPNGYSTTKSLNLDIVNPGLNVATTYIPTATVGSPYSVTLAAIGGLGPYSWKLAPGTNLPPGLALSSAGVISGTPTRSGTDGFKVVVQDAAGATRTMPLYLRVRPSSAVSITTTTLPDATAGHLYIASLSGSGGTHQYTWAVTPGSTLPAGLSLTSTGQIGGIPTTPGRSTFSVTLTDSKGNTDTSSLSLTVRPSALQVSTITLPEANQGEPYSQTLTAVGGTQPYQWSVNSGSPLPTGLSLSPNGTLSGTPNVLGTSNFTVTVTDAKGQSSSMALSLTVVPTEPLVMKTTAIPNEVVGLPVNVQLDASGGQLPYSWYVIQQSLPPGLRLSSSGTLSGIPNTAGQYTFTLEVMDSETVPVFVKRKFTMDVIGPLTVTTNALPSATATTPYSVQLTASGGHTPYTWTLSSTSALPQGLSLSSSGLISGTPTAAVYGATFTVIVSDSSVPRNSAQKTLSLTVAPAPKSGK